MILDEYLNNLYIQESILDPKKIVSKIRSINIKELKKHKDNPKKLANILKGVPKLSIDKITKIAKKYILILKKYEPM